MSLHRVTEVMVAENWGTRGVSAAPGTTLGLPSGTFSRLYAPKGGGGDLIPGDFTVLNPNTQGPFELNPPPTSPHRRGWFPTTGSLEFAQYDPIYGVKKSNVIEYNKITNITITPFQVQTPAIIAFHACFNTGTVTSTPRGTNLTVKVAVNSYRTEGKAPLITTVPVGGSVPATPLGQPLTPPLPATDAEIQAAHYTILQNILNSDPEGVFFDKLASLALSGAVGNEYRCIFLVEQIRPADYTSQYANIRPAGLEVSLLEGFTNMKFEEVMTLPIFNASLTSASYSSYLGSYLRNDLGSGLPEQVRWSEVQHLGQAGYTNSILYPNQKNLASNLNKVYDCINIDYFSTLNLAGENNSKSLAKSLTIWISADEGSARPRPSSDFHWYNGSFGITPDFAVDPGVPTPFSGIGNVVAIPAIALPTFSVVPVSSANNLAFCNVSDTNMVTDTFIGNLRLSLM